jgi:hypothetical protein
MPAKVKPWVKAEHQTLFEKNLTPLSRLILITLRYWDRGNDRGCFAKKTTIAGMMGISLHQLRRGLKELAEKNFIHIERHGQGNTDSIYVIESETQEFKESETLPSSLYKEEKNEVEPGLSSEDVTETATDSSEAADHPIDQSATKRCHRRLQALIGILKWDIWFNGSYVAEETQEQVVLYAPSMLAADWISKNYADELFQVMQKKVVIKVRFKA